MQLLWTRRLPSICVRQVVKGRSYQKHINAVTPAMVGGVIATYDTKHACRKDVWWMKEGTAKERLMWRVCEHSCHMEQLAFQIINNTCTNNVLFSAFISNAGNPVCARHLMILCNALLNHGCNITDIRIFYYPMNSTTHDSCFAYIEHE